MNRRQTRLWAIGCIAWILALNVLDVCALIFWDHGFRACAIDVFLLLVNFAIITYHARTLRRTFEDEPRRPKAKARKQIGPRQEWLP